MSSSDELDYDDELSNILGPLSPLSPIKTPSPVFLPVSPAPVVDKVPEPVKPKVIKLIEPLKRKYNRVPMVSANDYRKRCKKLKSCVKPVPKSPVPKSPVPKSPVPKSPVCVPKSPVLAPKSPPPVKMPVPKISDARNSVPKMSVSRNPVPQASVSMELVHESASGSKQVPDARDRINRGRFFENNRRGVQWYHHDNVLGVLCIRSDGFTVTTATTSISFDGGNIPAHLFKCIGKLYISFLVVTDDFTKNKWKEFLDILCQYHPMRKLKISKLDHPDPKMCPYCSKRDCHRWIAVAGGMANILHYPMDAIKH